ncbi:DsbA family protein [Chitinophaga sp. GbtcB8]|uniref:DsbA family protein n=1 Tax=Chitinophaga sp. GbtcB8 TaxID=2824753 RepID=UPI001C306790|nr:DsbA family protein [Chitinophaga sp. GbtcB8]
MKMFYFTDPMCSWCYGFSPAVKKLKENYPDIDLQIISGGFSPYSQQVVDQEYKDFLAFHWRNVNQRSRQFFDHSMKFISETFRYDTEPSSRALTVMQELLPKQDFEFLSLMQKSFYVEGKDITNDVVLARLAEEFGIEKKIFLEKFHSEEMKRKTNQGFQFSRQLGVQGFPTMLTLENGNTKVITRGFQDYDSLKVIVDNWLSNLNVSPANNGQSCSGDTCEC